VAARLPSRLSPVIAAAIALLGWSALALQCYLVVERQMAAGTTWMASVVLFFSFFTITTNTLTAIVLSVPLVAAASRLGRWLASANVRSATATYMAVVGLVYSLALRQVWDPQGPQLVADRLLHDALPILYVLFWGLFVEKGRLRWRDVAGWLIYPLLYLGYSLVRGALIDWYPYYFVDVTRLGYPRAMLHAGIVLVAFAVVGAVVVAVDRVLGTRRSASGSS
jgi:hypothetical protein